MNASDEPDHDPLIDEFRDLFAHDDPVPPLVREAGRAALGWRRLDADLAELLSDSSLEEDALAVARGGATLRSVSFSAGSLSIDLEIHGEGADRMLLGQLSPPARAKIEVQTPDLAASVATEADGLGRFRTKLPATSPVRLRVATGDPAAPEWVETSWIPL
ncbi:MAG TPA: hypothetical protein VG186_16150 [Solirubrobacteraceae bacterium]|jgi:hypothetical protein|nr:hypothetical protein [Solirubrobacteraceae bacterium]